MMHAAIEPQHIERQSEDRQTELCYTYHIGSLVSFHHWLHGTGYHIFGHCEHSVLLFVAQIFTIIPIKLLYLLPWLMQSLSICHQEYTAISHNNYWWYFTLQLKFWPQYAQRRNRHRKVKRHSWNCHTSQRSLLVCDSFLIMYVCLCMHPYII